MRDFEAAQAQAMELLLQQCVDTSGNELHGTRYRCMQKPAINELPHEKVCSFSHRTCSARSSRKATMEDIDGTG